MPTRPWQLLFECGRGLRAYTSLGIFAMSFAGPRALLAQDVQQVLNMAYPPEGTVARLFVDLFGNSLGGWPTVVGDVNGDGRDDFFWARWSWAEDTWPDSLLVFGGEHLVGITPRQITEVPHLRIRHEQPPDRLRPACWRNAAPAGDLDRDGFEDFVFTACSFNAPDAQAAGRAILIFGQPSFPAEAQLADLAGAGIRSLNIVSEDEGRGLGLSANRVGDLNGDGREELALGAHGEGTLSGPHAGWLYVLFGGQIGPDDIEIADVGTSVGGFVLQGAVGEGGPLVGDSLGSTFVEGAGDVNGDGLDDLVVPAIGVNGAAGAVYA